MSNTRVKAPSTWDFRESRIEDGVGGSDFVTNDSVIIAATPIAEYSQAAVTEAKVIGLIQSWNNNQSRNAPEVFEVGSNGKYVIATRKVSGNLTLNRVLFDGANLLSVLYAVNGTNVAAGDFDNDLAGYGQFLINLGSSFFAKPLGLIFSFRDSNNDPVGAFFFIFALGSHRWA